MISGRPVCSYPWPAAVVHRFGAVIGIILLAAGCVAPAAVSYVPAGTGTVAVALTGFRSDRGTAVVSLFHGAGGFPDEVAASAATVSTPIREGAAAVTFTGLSYGEYAISVLHDEDGDGEMATGLFGLPREGFGFSGAPDYRFGQPEYASARFLLLEPRRELTIGIRYETGRRQHREEGRAAETHRPGQE